MADPLNSGNGGATPTATLADTFKTIYERQLLKNARNNLLHQKFGRKRRLKSGETMEIRKATALAAVTTAITEGVIPTAQSFTISKVNVSVETFGGFIKGTDIVTAVAFDPLLSMIAEELGAQAGESIDTVTRDVLVAGTAVQYAGGVATDRDEITDADILQTEDLIKARATLVTALAPMVNGGYDAIIHPLTHADLLRDETIRAAFHAGDHKSELYDGMVGKFMGIRFHESPLAKVFADAGAGAAVDVYATLIFGKDAYCVADLVGIPMEMIYKPVGSAGTEDPLNQFWTSGWKTSHGSAIERQTYMLRLEHAVSNG